MPNIEKLVLNGCHKITDIGITSLAQQSNYLWDLEISGLCYITDASIIELKKCKALKSLNVSQCNLITHASLYASIIFMTALRSLNIYQCSNLSDTYVVDIQRSLPKLIIKYEYQQNDK